MRKKALALITCTATVALLAGCGTEAIVQNGDPAGQSLQISDADEDVDEKILVARADPTIEVSAEEFQNMQGYSFNVPDGAENVYYTIDTESNFGTVRFTLDGVEWSASEIHLPGFDLCHPSLGNGEIEVSCDFKDDPAMKVHGVAPTAKGIYIKYDDNSERYAYSACWNLDDEEYSISLDCYSEAPIDSMPVEVFQ